MKLAALWLCCGIAASGFINANLRMQFGCSELNSTYNRRQDLAYAVGWSPVAGPIALVISPIMTGAWYVGWSLNGKPTTPEECEGYGR